MNLNKDYIITVDVKQATVITPSKMNFYITDIKTANIFAQLVFNASESELIRNYKAVDNAEDFEITLRIIKPNNQFMEAKFTLLDQLEAFFMVDLTDEFKDYIGTYKCELFVDSKVNGELERITTASFRYKVLASIANSLDDIIEGDPDYPILDDLMDRIEAMNPDYYATNANLNLGLSTKANKNHTHDEYATNESVNEAMDGVPDIITSYLTGVHDSIAVTSPFKMQTKIDSPLDIRTVVDTESDIMNIEYPYVGMIVYVRDTGKRYEVLTLAPKEVGLASIANACVGTYRELNYADKEYVDEAVANVSGGGADVDLTNLVVTNSISMGRKADTTIGEKSFAVGYDVEASGLYSHAEGEYATASGAASHAEGSYTTASGYYSHAEGIETEASSDYSHAEGFYTTASGMGSHVEGAYTTASSRYQHVQGKYNIEDTAETYAHIVGNGDENARSNAHTLDWDGNAWFAGTVSIGEENKELATTGYVDEAVANAGGGSVDTTDLAISNSLTVGNRTEIYGTVVGVGSCTIGNECAALGDYSTAKGSGTCAIGEASSAEGGWTYANGSCSHVEGLGSSASGECSHAEGHYVNAASPYQHVQGKFNILDASERYAHIVGNGDAGDESNEWQIRESNAHTLDWSGNAWFAGDVYVGGTSQDDGDILTTKAYVDNAVSNAGTGGGSIDTNDLVITNSLSVGPGCNAGDYQLVHGRYPGDNSADKYAHVVGNGEKINNKLYPNNCYTLDWDGNAWYKGDVYTGGTYQNDASKLATEAYVDEAVANVSGGGSGEAPSYPTVYDNYTGGDLHNNYDYFISYDPFGIMVTLPKIKSFTEKHLYVCCNESNYISISGGMSMSDIVKMNVKYENADGSYSYEYMCSDSYDYMAPADGYYELILTYMPFEEVWMIRIIRISDITMFLD